MAEEGERQGRGRERGIEHDPLNEFGEETWTAVGENTFLFNNIIHREGGSNDDVDTWSGTLPIPPASCNIIIKQGSEETFESKEFLTEEVEEISFKSTGSVQSLAEVDDSQEIGETILKESKELIQLSLVPFSAPLVPSSRALLNQRGGERQLCRICHDRRKGEGFISPCDCKGTLSLVHSSCLERWLAQADTNNCEICRRSFRIARIPKHGVFCSIAAWARCPSSWRERRNLLLDLTVFIICCPIIGFTNFIAFKMSDALFSHDVISFASSPSADQALSELEGRVLMNVCRGSVLSLVAMMNISFIGWLVVRAQHHLNRWHSWRRRNSIISLIGYPTISTHSSLSTSSSLTNIPTITF